MDFTLITLQDLSNLELWAKANWVNWCSLGFAQGKTGSPAADSCPHVHTFQIFFLEFHFILPPIHIIGIVAVSIQYNIKALKYPLHSFIK